MMRDRPAFARSLPKVSVGTWKCVRKRSRERDILANGLLVLVEIEREITVCNTYKHIDHKNNARS